MFSSSLALRPTAASFLTVAAATAALAAPLPDQGTWTQTLHGRDLHGHAVALDSPDAAFLYDSTLNVTWLRRMPASGALSQAQALAWADALVVGGFSDWRLPRTLDTGAPACARFTYSGGDCGYNVPTGSPGAYSEMAHLLHVTLGNLAAYTAQGQFRGWEQQGIGWGLANTATFEGLVAGPHWSATRIVGAPGFAFMFDPALGLQSVEDRSLLRHALALRDGDVLSPVPEPGTALLAALGVAALLRRRRQEPIRAA
jgi:MYXO-CTERM domain-containing protein